MDLMDDSVASAGPVTAHGFPAMHNRFEGTWPSVGVAAQLACPPLPSGLNPGDPKGLLLCSCGPEVLW
jgi:hypothetical protein